MYKTQGQTRTPSAHDLTRVNQFFFFLKLLYCLVAAVTGCLELVLVNAIFLILKKKPLRCEEATQPERRGAWSGKSSAAARPCLATDG